MKHKILEMILFIINLPQKFAKWKIEDQTNGVSTFYTERDKQNTDMEAMKKTKL